jgi:asparagine synthetase B (glutamine-hydrolysing)
MKPLYMYNISIDELYDIHISQLYEEKRRDSIFAGAFYEKGKIIAFRDHLGVVPLYYRKRAGKYIFSSMLSDMVDQTDDINNPGLKSFIGFQSPKILPLFSDVKIVDPGTVIKIDINTEEIDIVYIYKIKPGLNSYSSEGFIFSRLDYLFSKAIKRSLRCSGPIGLYLSGGIDSSLIAFYLLQNKVELTCYTSSVFQEDKHYLQSKKVCDILGVDNHVIDIIKYEESNKLINDIHRVNGSPGATSASLNIISLWNNTNINTQSQLYFGQNLDTLFMVMGNQYRTYLSELLPGFIKRKVKFNYYGEDYHMNLSSVTANYLNYRSNGYVQSNAFLDNTFRNNLYSVSHKLILAGMFCGHTPADSDSFIMPSINIGQTISNPYYDMDLVEFLMGIPIKHKIKVKLNRRMFLNPMSILRFHKRLYLRFASTVLPKELVFPKQSFMIPSFNLITDSLVDTLPSSFDSIELNNIQSRISVKTLENFLDCIKK